MFGYSGVVDCKRTCGGRKLMRLKSMNWDNITLYGFGHYLPFTDKGYVQTLTVKRISVLTVEKRDGLNIGCKEQRG